MTALKAHEVAVSDGLRLAIPGLLGAPLGAWIGTYLTGHTLMIGDAPGDQNAAAANKCLFFPINPGHEEASWKRLLDEGIDRFFAGKFAGEYQKALLDEFDTYLPERPPWTGE